MQVASKRDHVVSHLRAEPFRNTVHGATDHNLREEAVKRTPGTNSGMCSTYRGADKWAYIVAGTP